MTKPKKFKLFANCIPVKGISRSLICDLQRNDYELIPTSLCDILLRFPIFDLSDLIAVYGESEQETLTEYIQFLQDNSFGFWTDQPELFPALSMAWQSASPISNAIIDSDQDSTHNFADLFQQLENLKCEHVLLRFFAPIEAEKLIEIVELLDRSSITSIDLSIPYDPDFTDEDYRSFLRRFPRITQLIIHSSPENKSFTEAEHRYDLMALIYTTQTISNETHCGVIHPGYFVTNLPNFLESQKHNSCLNGKISINKNGQICNCPSMPTKFGNAKETTLKNVLTDPTFTAPWSVDKSQIETCRVCEFRFICTDCRAFTENNHPLGKPSKCGYDPYSGNWEKV